MQGLAKLCILGAILGFVLAVVVSLFMQNLMGLPPESFSRASTNLALIGIGLAVTFKEDGTKAPPSGE